MSWSPCGAACQDHRSPHLREAEPDPDLHDCVVPAGNAVGERLASVSEPTVTSLAGADPLSTAAPRTNWWLRWRFANRRLLRVFRACRIVGVEKRIRRQVALFVPRSRQLALRTKIRMTVLGLAHRAVKFNRLAACQSRRARQDINNLVALDWAGVPVVSRRPY
jgi:hypothetical protein